MQGNCSVFAVLKKSLSLALEPFLWVLSFCCSSCNCFWDREHLFLGQITQCSTGSIRACRNIPTGISGSQQYLLCPAAMDCNGVGCAHPTDCQSASHACGDGVVFYSFSCVFFSFQTFLCRSFSCADEWNLAEEWDSGQTCVCTPGTAVLCCVMVILRVVYILCCFFW